MNHQCLLSFKRLYLFLSYAILIQGSFFKKHKGYTGGSHYISLEMHLRNFIKDLNSILLLDPHNKLTERIYTLEK